MLHSLLNNDRRLLSSNYCKLQPEMQRVTCLLQLTMECCHSTLQDKQGRLHRIIPASFLSERYRLTQRNFKENIKFQGKLTQY